MKIKIPNNFTFSINKNWISYFLNFLLIIFYYFVFIFFTNIILDIVYSFCAIYEIIPRLYILEFFNVYESIYISEVLFFISNAKVILFIILFSIIFLILHIKEYNIFIKSNSDGLVFPKAIKYTTNVFLTSLYFIAFIFFITLFIKLISNIGFEKFENIYNIMKEIVYNITNRYFDKYYYTEAQNIITIISFVIIPLLIIKNKKMFLK